MTGRIVAWSPTYGFIKPDDGGPDVFFNGSSADARRQLYALLRRDDRVSYEVVPDPRKPGRTMAADIVWVKEPPACEIQRRASREGTAEEWKIRERINRQWSPGGWKGRRAA